MRTGLLPGGWKQRLSLGCALLHEPRILFLDEPTSGVDPSSRRHFWELIHELAEGGVTVFVTTHYMEEAEYCDRLALIYRGEIIAMGTPTQLKESTALKVQLRVAAEARGGVEHFGPGPGKARTGTECGPECSIDPPSSLVLPHVVPRQSPATTSDTKTMPTLEDVFVALIEARDRQDGVQKEFQQ
jgi:ABC-2 type transport system ATP-binding protein